MKEGRCWSHGRERERHKKMDNKLKATLVDAPHGRVTPENRKVCFLAYMLG